MTDVPLLLQGFTIPEMARYYLFIAHIAPDMILSDNGLEVRF